eukprot:5028436-Lingulodinium_polyedra.AAC.1
MHRPALAVPRGPGASQATAVTRATHSLAAAKAAVWDLPCQASGEVSLPNRIRLHFAPAALNASSNL